MIKQIFSSLRMVLSRDEVRDRVKIAEDLLYGKASANDLEGLKVISELVSSLCDDRTESVVDGGIFVVFKVKKPDGDFQVFSKRLTVRERNAINERPTLLHDPFRLLECLEEAVGVDKHRALEMRAAAGRSGDANTEIKLQPR